MPALYCVFGNPIAHSKSPAIHTRFAAMTGENLRYEARLAPLENFTGAVQRFAEDGGLGANVTVPFKEDAFRLCTALTPRAQRAGAVNTLVKQAHGWQGDNTDGAGLVRDITVNLGFSIKNKRILLLGAGGAARGVIAPLLEQAPTALVIANRTADKARQLAAQFADLFPIVGLGYTDLLPPPFDLVINATSASLGGESLPLPSGLFAAESLAYDMMYGKGLTPFLQQAEKDGAGQLADGLGMLVEQAAEAFCVWRGIRPETRPVLDELRTALKA